MYSKSTLVQVMSWCKTSNMPLYILTTYSICLEVFICWPMFKIHHAISVFEGHIGQNIVEAQLLALQAMVTEPFSRTHVGLTSCRVWLWFAV